MDTDEQLGQMAAGERARRSAHDAVTHVVRRDGLGGRLAGIWVEDEERMLVIAVTSDAGEIERELRAVASVPMRVVTFEHSYNELETLVDAIVDYGEQVGAPVSAVGVDEVANRVDAMLEDRDAPASKELRRHFAGRPIHWDQGVVVAA